MKTRSIKKNIIFNLIKIVSTIIFPLVAFPYLSRVLHPESLGKINFGLSVVSWFSLFASLGVSVYAIRECSSVREDKSILSNTASQIFSINIITTFISFILLGLSLWWFSSLANYRFLIIIQSITIIFVTLGCDWLNSAMEDFKYITIRTIFFQVLSLILIFLFVKSSSDYILYAVICLVGTVGVNLVNIRYRKRYCNISFITAIDWKKHLKPILLLFVMLLSQTVFFTVDSIMLGIMKGDYSVGIYTTALKIVNIIIQLVTSILWVILPRISNYYSSEDFIKINSLLYKVLGFHIIIGIPIVLGVFFLSEEIILIIAGKEYVDSIVILKILMIGSLFTLLGGSFIGNCILLPLKKEHLFMVICCITAIINIAFNYILIPKYGAVGAALTTVLSSFAMFFILLFCIDKRIKLNKVFNLIISTALSCVSIVFVCYICKDIENIWIRILVSIMVSSFLYFFLLFIFKNVLVIDLVTEIKNKLSNWNKQ